MGTRRLDADNPGATVDYEFVAREIAELLDDADIQGIGYDRWRIDLMKKEFEEIGVELPLVEYGQGYKDMSPALDGLEAALLNAKLAHGMNPVLTMCAANAVASQDPPATGSWISQRRMVELTGWWRLQWRLQLRRRAKKPYRLHLGKTQTSGCRVSN